MKKPETGALEVPTPDRAMESIANLIGGLVGMMKMGQLPAVDLADLKVMFERRPGDGPRIWYVGEGTASGVVRAEDATRMAIADLCNNAKADGASLGD